MEYVYRVNFLINFLIASDKIAWLTITTPDATNLFAIVFAIDSKFPLVVAASKTSVMIGIKNELKNKQLHIIPVNGLPLKSTWNIVWLKNKNLSPQMFYDNPDFMVVYEIRH